MDRVAVVIMAGGRGERFWPKSRAHRPKQFLQLFGEGTLLQQAYHRARRLAPADQVYVVTGDDYRDLVAEQLPEHPRGQVIVEPVGRDTAPCIGLAALVVERQDPGTVMIVLPSDHAILNEDRFVETLQSAARAAASGAYLVTIGIRPTRPETGYGYIQYGEPLAGEGKVHAVRRFAEKPDAETAQRFLMEGDYLWNSGMFAWQAGVIRDAMAAHLPELHHGLERIRPALGTEAEARVLESEFGLLPPISIDFGVMEKADNVLVLPGDFGWDDLGTWAAMPRIGQADEQGNVISGQAVLIDSKDCIVEGGRRLVVGFGVEKLVLVDTEDVLFVSDASRMDQLKRVVAELQARGLEAYLTGEGGMAPVLLPPGPEAASAGVPALPADVDLTTVAIPVNGEVRTIDKPWGREIWWAQTGNYVGKLIQVKAGQALSLQYHEKKQETMLFVAGKGRLVLGERAIDVEAGMAVTIEPGTVHRVIAETDLSFFEVSTPEVEDVVRLEDRYGRTGGDEISR